MPTYGESKARDMKRSVLPSKRRSGARRAKKHFHKVQRTQVKAALRQVKDLGDLPTRFDPQMDQYLEGKIRWSDTEHIKGIVRNRREGDKVVPLRRWFAARVKHIQDRDARRAEANTILGNDVIGWHAKEHVQDIIDPHNEERPPSKWWVNYVLNKPGPRYPVLSPEEIPDLIADAIRAGLFHKLNDAVSEHNTSYYTRSKEKVEKTTYDHLKRCFVKYMDYDYTKASPNPPQVKSIADIPRFLQVLEYHASEQAKRVSRSIFWVHSGYSRDSWFSVRRNMHHFPYWLANLKQFLQRFKAGEFRDN